MRVRAGVTGRIAFLLAVAVLLSLLIPAARAQDVRSRLDEARERRETLQSRLDTATERLAELQSRVARLEDQRVSLQAELDELEARAERAREHIGDRARSFYKHGTMSPVLAFLGGEGPDDALDRAVLLERFAQRDRAVSEAAQAARRRRAALADRLTEQEAELEAAREEHRQTVAQLNADLEEARELEHELEGELQAQIEAERQRRAAARRARAAARQAAMRAAGGMACPVGQPRSYSDTWGAPRSGGRRHKGTDILAPYGTPIYAVVGGVVDVRSPGRNAGNWLILRGVDGTSYYYMHLQSVVVGDGTEVAAGQQIATNGDTGNASGTPHLHFEQHPGGGGAVNPYPLVRRACG